MAKNCDSVGLIWDEEWHLGDREVVGHIQAIMWASSSPGCRVDHIIEGFIASSRDVGSVASSKEGWGGGIHTIHTHKYVLV